MKPIDDKMVEEVTEALVRQCWKYAGLPELVYDETYKNKPPSFMGNDMRGMAKAAILAYESAMKAPWYVDYRGIKSDQVILLERCRFYLFHYYNTGKHLPNSHPVIQELLRDLAEALRDSPKIPDSGWQDISTAPKDGTEIVVVDFVGNKAVVVWEKSNYWGQTNIINYANGREFYNAVHWLPLPKTIEGT